MMQGEKMPAGAGNKGGRVRAILHKDIVTQLGTFQPRDVLALWAAAAAAWMVCSGVLHVGYLIAKGLVCMPW